MFKSLTPPNVCVHMSDAQTARRPCRDRRLPSFPLSYPSSPSPDQDHPTKEFVGVHDISTLCVKLTLTQPKFAVLKSQLCSRCRLYHSLNHTLSLSEADNLTASVDEWLVFVISNQFCTPKQRQPIMQPLTSARLKVPFLLQDIIDVAGRITHVHGCTDNFRTTPIRVRVDGTGLSHL